MLAADRTSSYRRLGRLAKPLRQWRIRPKLVAVVIGPTVVAVLLASWSAVGTWGTLKGYSQSVALLKLDNQVDALADAVQTERDLSTIYVAGQRMSGAAQVAAARQATDQALGAYQNAVDGIDTAGFSDLHAIVTAIAGEMQGLAFVRGAVDNAGLTQGAIVGTYNDMVAALAALVSYVPGTDPQVAAQIGVLSNFFGLKESTSQVRSGLAAILTNGSFKVGDLQTLTDLRGQQQSLLASFLASSSRAERAEYSTTVQGLAPTQVQTIEDDSVQAATAPTLPDGVQTWFTVSTALMGQLRTVQSQILEGALADVEDLYGNSIETFVIALAALVFTVGLAVWVSFRVARSISTQLKQLGSSATKVATEWLPEVMRRLRLLAVDPFADFAIVGQLVHTPDEIGEVAQALNAVSEACLQLARQQAELRVNISQAFTNLARRNQRYVSDMLKRLDEWERDEQDPDVLDRLYALDQLAAQMRRTVDSLFVIAGVQDTSSQRDPVTVDDVVGAALSEIERYNRVMRPSAGDARVVGWAVVDVAHLLAELFDNATRFTPKNGSDAAVDLVFRRATDGIIIVIADRGVGMAPADMDGANKLVSTQAAELIFTSMQTLGLLVVARLAAKHKVAVRFRPRPAPQHGVIVEVHLPSTIVFGPHVNRTVQGRQPSMVLSSGLDTRPQPPPARTPILAGPRAAIEATDTCPPQRTPEQPRSSALTNGELNLSEPQLWEDDGPRHAELRIYTAEELKELRDRIRQRTTTSSTREDDQPETQPHHQGRR